MTIDTSDAVVVVQTDRRTTSWRRATQPMLIATITGSGLALLSGPALARGLGVVERGQFQVISLIYSLLPEVLGISQAVALASAKPRGTSFLGWPFLCSIATWPVAALGVIALAHSHILVASRPIILLLALLYPITLFMQLLKGLLQQHHLFTELAVARFVDVSGSTVIMLALFAVGILAIRSATWALLIPEVAAIVIAVSFLRRFGPVKIRLGPDWGATAAFGLRYHPSKLLYLVIAYADQCYVVVRYSARDLGIYAVGVAVSAIGTLVPGALQQVATPVMGRLETADNAASTTGFRSVIRLTIVLGMALVFSYALVAPVLIPTLFGQAFKDAWPVGLLLLSSSCVNGISLVLEGALAGIRHAKSVILSRCLGLFGMAAGLAALGQFGISAVATASLVSSVATTLGLMYAASAIGFRFRDIAPASALHDVRMLMGSFRSGAE